MMNKNNIVTFGAGFIMGAAVGVGGFYLYFRRAVKKIQQTADDQVHQLEKYYGKTDEYKREERFPDYEEDTLSEAQNGRHNGILSNEQRADIKEQQKRLQANWAGTTNYAKMYQNKEEESLANGIDPAEMEFPTEEESEEHIQTLKDIGAISDEEKYHEEHQKNKNRPPKIISAEDASELPGYIEERTLYYYTEDEVLVDDSEEMIDDPEILIGDALDKFGFAQNDERIIFVLNYAQDVCYEIQKVNGAFSEE